MPSFFLSFNNDLLRALYETKLETRNKNMWVHEYDDISAFEEEIISVEGWTWSQPEEVSGASHRKYPALKKD